MHYENPLFTSYLYLSITTDMTTDSLVGKNRTVCDDENNGQQKGAQMFRSTEQASSAQASTSAKRVDKPLKRVMDQCRTRVIGYVPTRRYSVRFLSQN